jgi:hypothetical protein
MHRLFANSTAVLAAASSYPDLAVAGDLYIYSINPVLVIATGTPTPISVHVYAWMENVELGPPTATQVEITTEGYDEGKQGPVERTATFMAKVMNALSVIPSIGVLAKASSFIFQGAAGISAWFGWSRPQIKDHASYIKNRPWANTSQTIGSETIERISFDPLQELTIDPRVCASSQDEMSLAFLNSVQTYLTTFEWEDDSSIMSAPIWKCIVHPQLCTYGVFPDGAMVLNVFQPSAMAFAANPFLYWRGKIKFRLEIVCSNFHRGKLAITYEPNMDQGALIDTAIALNKNYIKIIDIQETQDIEFCINYAQPYVWLKTVDETSTPNFHGSSFTYTGHQQIGNGYIAITPFTALQSPDKSHIFVNVYVSGEDMQYNILSNDHLPLQRKLITESFDEGVQPQVGYTCLELNSTSDDGSNVSEYCFGEQPVSLRSCLKRYVTVSTDSGVNTTSAVAHNIMTFIRRTILPAYPAYGIATSSATRPTLQQILPYAYLGVRGSVRKRLRFISATANSSAMQALKVTLRLNDIALTNSGFAEATSYVHISEDGSAIFLPWTNGGCEVELPYYSPNLFQFAFSDNFYGTLTNGEMSTTWAKNFDIAINTYAVNSSVTLALDAATGEDFTFLRFNGAPYSSVISAPP